MHRNKTLRPRPFLLAALVLGLLVGTGTAFADVYIDSNGISAKWIIEGENDGSFLTVNGSGSDAGCNAYRQRYDRGEPPVFSVFDDQGQLRPDGSYHWQVDVLPRVDPDILDAMRAARYEGDDGKLACQLEAEDIIQSEIAEGHFIILEGKIHLPSNDPERSGGSPEPGSGGIDAGKSGAVVAGGTGDVAGRQVISGDLVVYNSICVGFDCPTNPSFGADTIRLQENNLRIHFDDTSTAASFPRNDWRLVANDQANGGASKFSIDDVSNNRTPFTVEAAAPSHSLYVDDGGRVGLGTSTPVVNVHTKDGDTPTLRLEQDGSSGFAPQTWDVAGNETSFFIRDATNGSTLPLRIRPGASSNALVIDTDDDVGVGVLSPSASLHVRGTDGSTGALIEEASSTTATREILELRNNGLPRLILDNTDTDDGDGNSTNGSGVGDGRWFFGLNNSDEFVISVFASPTNEVKVDTNGDMTVRGDVTANGVLLTSDRNLKTDIQPLDGRDVLAAVAEMPIANWTFRAGDGVRHVGPMAQDFHAAFGLGPDDRHISPMDATGVALAAVQGLNQVVNEKDARIGELEAKNAELEARLAALESMIRSMAEADGQ